MPEPAVVEIKTCHKEKHLTNVIITCDYPPHIRLYGGDWTRFARDLERWVKEFHEFIRDHRSQDPVHLDVERIVEDVCSFCGEHWEAEIDLTAGEFCAYCGSFVEKPTTGEEK